jgi:hypothetical protein
MSAIKLIIGVLWSLLGLAIWWILDHALFDWFVHYLEDKWDFKEATLIASISSYVIPAIVSAIIIAIVYRLGQHELGSTVDNPEPYMSVSDAIDYIVNDSQAVLTQPRAPWIQDVGRLIGHRMIENGVEHADARRQLNERLISGMPIWGFRQIQWTHSSIQFEQSLRKIEPGYWDRMQLDFVNCFYRTTTMPQTATIPGKQADLHWTGLMVSRKLVFREWPPQPRWLRLWRWITRKQRIVYVDSSKLAQEE